MNLAVFDVDGTLLNNRVEEDACYARALREQLSLPTLDTDWSRYTHVSDDGIASEAFVRAFGQPLPATLRETTIERFVELLQATYRTSPISTVSGSAELLLALRSLGWAVALATGAWKRAAEYKLGSAGLSLDGVPVATSEDGPARVTIVSRAITLASASYAINSFARVVAVGDGVWDVSAARDLALPFLGVGESGRSDRLRRAGASHVVADFSDVDRTLHLLKIALLPRAGS